MRYRKGAIVIGSFVRSSLVRRTLTLMLGLSVMLPATGAVAVDIDDDTFAGAPALSPSPMSGELSGTDIKDRFRVPISGDQVLTVSLSGPAGQDFDLSLYSPWVLDGSSEFDLVMRSQSEGSSEAITYLVPPGATGPYFLEVSAFVGASGSYELTWDVADEPAPRLSGSDRYRTSYAASASTFAAATAAVVASGANFPDALSAAGLAGAVEGPVLLAPYTTDPDDPRVVDLCRELVRLGCTKVYVIGGPGAVTDQVLDRLDTVASDPERIGGTTRYQTAQMVADKIQLIAGPVSAAFVVRGDAYPDALAVSPYAYSQKLPILLTRPDALDADVSTFIESNDITDIVIAGGESAVSTDVQVEIDGLNGAATVVERLFGSDRIATAVDVAHGCVDRGWGSWERIGIATASNFPDALSGGFACGSRSGVLLLTSSSSLSPAADAAIGANASPGSMALILGGQMAVAESVRSQIAALLP